LDGHFKSADLPRGARLGAKSPVTEHSYYLCKHDGIGPTSG
jgi:hypothetical protein